MFTEFLSFVKRSKDNSNGNVFNVKEKPLTISELRNMWQRNSFSRYLPYRAYDQETGLYFCQDNTIGLIWECLPLLFIAEKELKTLEGLFRLRLPDFTVMQFILVADPYIDPFLDKYVYSKQYAPEFVKKAYQKLADFYKKQTEIGSIPIRNFRLFVTLKIHEMNLNSIPLNDIIANIEDIFKGVGIYPFKVTPDVLLSFLRRILNDIDYDIPEYCEYTDLSKQIIKAETVIERDMNLKALKIGGKYFRCATPKSLPNEISSFWANGISGSYTGVTGDVSQIGTPFMIVLNIIYRNLKAKIHSKANVVLAQQSFGSFAPGLARRKDEFLWAAASLDKGDLFFEVMYTVWVFSKDIQQTRESLYRVFRLWESTGAVMQEESTLLFPLFLYSLPLGFYIDLKSLEILDRTFIVPQTTLSAMLPIQADYMGTKSPVLLFQGRKGQLIGFDIYAKGASNYNWYVAAPTGKGKSFTVNYLVCNYYGQGAKIRIVDIGGSYKKLAKIFNGKFINFSTNSNICLNPFTYIKDPNYDLPVIAAVIQQMSISQTETLPTNTETAFNLIRSAVNYVYKTFGNKATIDHVYGYLAEFPKYSEEYETLCEGKEICAEDFKLISTHLAFNLHKFTTGGQYGRWFSGDGNLNIAEDDFIVLELEELKPQKDLYKVVVLQVLNTVTLDLYLSDRSRPRMVILDEAWQFLQDSEIMQRVIEEGYRRARKYGGSFGIITQSILDFEKFGGVGRVINTNCEFKFFLESSDFELAKEKKFIDYDPFTMEILKSIKYNAPKYSELFIHSDTFGCGVCRLAVDRYSYYVYTSNPKEISQIESLVAQGKTYEEAIEYMLNTNHS